MAPVADEDDVMTVKILKVLNGGNFVAAPASTSNDAYNYSIFLADLNNSMNNKGQRGPDVASHIFKTGEVCAVYCSIQGENAKLWYRGRILLKLKNVQGITAKVLLVDHGQEICVPGTCIRKLSEKYQKFPNQQMNCQLYGLKPLTFAASATESLVAKKTTTTWDSAAKTRLQELTKGAICRIKSHLIDGNGVHHVTLFALSVTRLGYDNFEVNVNELFVQEQYAVFENPIDSRKELDLPQDQTDNMPDKKRDLDVWSSPVSCKEQEELLIRKKMAEDIFQLRLDIADAAGDGVVPKLKGESSEDKVQLMPANNEDDISLSDDESCITDSLDLHRRKAGAREIMSQLSGETKINEEPTLKNTMLSSVPVKSTMPSQKPKAIWNRAEERINLKPTSSGPSQDTEVRSLTRNSEQSLEINVESQAMRSEKATAAYKMTTNDLSDSSEKFSDIEKNKCRGLSDSDSPRTSDDSKNLLIPKTRRKQFGSTTPGCTHKYEVECLQQRNKNDGNENSFKPAIDSKELLRLFSSPSAMTNSPFQISKENLSRTQPVSCDFTDVYVNDKPKFFTTIEEMNIPLEMRGCLSDKQTRTFLRKPTPIQAYAWPAILRGRDFVGVDRAFSGRTLGYLLPIMMQIVGTPLCYKNIPRGTGPIVLILTVDWSNARSISETCQTILYQYRSKYRTKVLYGGRGQLQEEMVSLINGCEVLIATIPSLLNMLQKGCTNLDKLCHLVFDSADVLIENFLEEIKEIMKIYAESLTKTISLNLPHQLVAMATEYTYGLKSLIGAYFDNPLIVIPSKLEIAVCKQLKQYVEICSSEQKLDFVFDFLRGDGAGHNVVMFVNSAGEAEKLEKLLQSESIAVIRATEFMPQPELKDIEASWKASLNSGQCILVLTDGVACRMSVKSATCIIHYDFPMKKTDFGNRMICMLGATKSHADRDAGCCSLILVTERNECFANEMVKLLKRSRQFVPPLLKSIAKRVEKEREERKKDCKICSDLKLFGICRDIQKCLQRHTIFADTDEPKTIPRSGVVKVKILDVVSANCYWGKIVDHTPSSGSPDHSKYDSNAYLKLAFEMQIYYQKSSNLIRHGIGAVGVLEGDVCVVKTEKGFQRVRVEAITRQDAQTAIATQVLLFGIDNAYKEKRKVEDLYVLPSNECFSLANVPPQAIELIVCGVKPVDKSFSWTVEACLRIDKLISGKTLEGRIVLGLRNTLWLDPLVEKTKLDNLIALTTTLHIGSELLQLGFADKNANHAGNLRELCKDSLPGVIITNVRRERKPEDDLPLICASSCETLTIPDDDYQDVYVSAAEDPGLFYVQLMKWCSLLDKMEDKIEAVMKVLPKHENRDVENLEPGSLCLAQFTIDDKWYRAKILEINKEGEYHVFYVDHGDREFISEERLWKAWPEVLELPLQAIECSLVNISSIAPEWTSADGDALWELCKEKLLVAQVKSTSASEYAGNIRHHIELFDTTGEHDINMSHELVFLGHAQGSQTCILEMFPNALLHPEDRECLNDCEKIPDICLQIYKTENSDRKCELAESLQSIILDADSESLSALVASGGLKAITKLLSLNKNKDIQKILVAAIVYLAFKEQRVADEVRKEGGLKTFCTNISETGDEEVKEQLAWALKNLSTTKRNKDAVRVYGGLAVICKLLKENKTQKVVLRAVEAVDVLCLENDGNCQCVHEENGLQALLQILQKSDDEKLMATCTAAISTLLANTEIRNKFRKNKGIDILSDFLSKCNDKTCLKNILQGLKNATNANQLNRDYMRNCDLVSKVERILHSSSHHGVTIKHLCNDLLNRIMTVTESTGSGQKTIHVPKIDAGIGMPPLLPMDDEPSFSPKTLWSQRQTTVTVAIQLRGVINEYVSITERRLYFSCLTADIKYELDLELYDAVNPSESKWKVLGGEVLITLAKTTKGAWPRLLKAEVKPQYIKLDFDRWKENLSDDDDDFDPTELPTLARTDSAPTKYSNGIPDLYASDSSDNESSDELFDEFGPIT